MTIARLPSLLASAILLLPGCGLFQGPLPKEAAPLADMEEPLALFEEPDDEELRQELPKGVFTGLHVEDYAESLDEFEAGSNVVRVATVVENSPADVEGLLPGDWLLSVRRNDEQAAVPVEWASQWRAIELDAEPGDRLHVRVDRAGSEVAATILPMRRVRPGGRHASERFREEAKAGVVIRSATEVEARRAGLGPGGGAVVVGLSRGSPWRRAGVEFNDLLVAVDGHTVHHPQVVLDAIRDAEEGQFLALRLHRDGTDLHIEAPVTRREEEIASFIIPLLFSHEKHRGRSKTSLLLGLLGVESTDVASETTLLWLIKIRSGDADRLKEVPAR